MSLAAGIDLSARRGLHMALLEDGTQLRALEHFPDVPATVGWLNTHAPNATVGIDAPQGLRLPLLGDDIVRARLEPPPPPGKYRRYRVCDYLLARRGIGLYLSPAAGEVVPEWMAVGFALFEMLRAKGLRTPRHPNDYSATLLEVYPYAVFVSLLGCVPARKTLPEGQAARLAALRAAGVQDVPPLSHDLLDAVAAAVGAAAFAASRGCALGQAEEGYIVLPVSETALLPRYRRC